MKKEGVEKFLGCPVSDKIAEGLNIESIDDFLLCDSFWESGKYCKYYEHKFDAYKNNKKKLYTYNKGHIFMEEPYSEKQPSGISYGFTTGKGKEVDGETLTKYFKEIDRNTFFEKQITHIPT